MSDVKVTNEPDPWAPYKEKTYTPDELESVSLPFSDGIDNTKSLRQRNISADELKEIASAASKKDSDLSSSEKILIEEYKYQTRGEYKRKYW